MESLDTWRTANRMAAGELDDRSGKRDMTHSRKNGRIVDGLTLFTKNVTLHFSGQVECAICYSYVLLFFFGLSSSLIFFAFVLAASLA